MPDGPIPAGWGRVLLDAEPGKGPVRVVRYDVTQVSVATSYGYATGTAVSSQLVCAKTPCAVDLIAGAQSLAFQAAHEGDVSTATFDVTAGRTMVVRHAVGHVDTNYGWTTIGVLGLALGSTSAVVGAVMIPVAGSVNEDGLRTAGTVMVGAGAAALALGIVSLVIGRSDIQPGATTQWTLPKDAAAGAARERAHAATMVATSDSIGIAW